MKMQDGLELLSRVLMEVLIAERKETLKCGEDKKSYVMGKIKDALSEPHSPSLLGIGDIGEILDTIGELINVVVKLLSLLGIFKHALTGGKKKEELEDE